MTTDEMENYKIFRHIFKGSWLTLELGCANMIFALERANAN